MVGMETIPAVVRRQDYDSATRLVRQLVENIQREDLNDVDRAAGLLKLKEVMQEEMEAEVLAEAAAGGREVRTAPWSRTITWAKVGKRLGYTRQRIHQLIRLLELPDDIKEDVRQGKLSERETRVYHGLRKRHQQALHRARYRENLSQSEVRSVARYLKEEPDRSVGRAIETIRQPVSAANGENESVFEAEMKPEDSGDGAAQTLGAEEPETGQTAERQQPAQALRSQPWTEGGVLPPRQTRPTSIDRLDYIRGHLARIQRQGLVQAERQEMVRLLNLIQQDVFSLLNTLEGAGETDP